MSPTRTCAAGHALAADATDCPLCAEEAATRSFAPGDDTVPASPAAVPAIAPPGYELLRELGRGGMGVVYEAVQVKARRVVALKMIRAGEHADDRDRARFQKEVEAIARLDHPHIVRVYEVGEHAGLPYFSLEFCGGGALDRRLRQTPLSPVEAAGLVRKLADAVGYAHGQGVLHRDLKPSNVLLTAEGQPKIADFGLAKVIDAPDAASARTHSGTVLGTPSYMAPEQAAGRVHDLGPACDVYALGAILYECLTGRPPFRAATVLETLRQVVETDAVPARALNPAVPRDLETVVHKCLHKEVTRRYPNAQALADDLARFVAGEPIHARPVGRLERALKWVRRNPVVSALAAAVLLVLLAGIAVSTYFAVDAARQAEDARRELARAEQLLYAARLREAQSLFGAADAVGAADRLADCPWEQRGWEFDFLAHTYFRQGQVPLAHAAAVARVALDPGGTRLATLGDDGVMTVWDVLRGERLWRSSSGWGGAGLAFSPEGHLVAAVGEDNAVRLHDAATGRIVGPPLPHPEQLAGLVFTPDGQGVITATVEGDVRFWDRDAGRVRRQWVDRQPLGGLALSPDGATLAVIFERGRLVLLDAATATVRQAWQAHAHGGTSVAWSPDGRLLASGCEDWHVHVYDAATGTRRHDFHGPAYIQALAFAPDGRRLYAAGNDSLVRVWGVDTGREEPPLVGHLGWVRDVALSRDGGRVVTASSDRTARIWDGRVPQGPRVWAAHDGQVAALVWGRDGRQVITGCYSASAGVWDVASGRPDERARSLDAFAAGVVQIGWLPGGGLVGTARDGTTRECDPATGRVVRTWHDKPPGTEDATAAAWSPDGTRFAVGFSTGALHVRDAASGERLYAFAADTQRVTQVAWSPDGRTLASVGPDPAVRLWDAATGDPVGELPSIWEYHSGVAWSPDGSGRLLVVGDRDARVWDVPSRRPHVDLKGHTGTVLAVAWSPDATRIATGSKDKRVRIWDAATGRCLLEWPSPTTWVASLAFSPDGRRLAVGLWDGTVLLCDAGRPGGLRELRGAEGKLVAVVFGPGDLSVVAATEDGRAYAWDRATGKALPAPPTPPVGGTSATSADGNVLARIVPGVVVLEDPQAEGAARREALPQLAQPRPGWHLAEAGRLPAESYAATVQRGLAVRAAGEVALSRADAATAGFCLLLAEAIRPRPTAYPGR